MEVVLTEEYTAKLREQISTLIDEVIKNKLEQIQPYKRYFTRNELQKYLQIGASTMEQLYKHGLTYAVVGNKHLFDIEDVYIIFDKLKTR